MHKRREAQVRPAGRDEFNYALGYVLCGKSTPVAVQMCEGVACIVSREREDELCTKQPDRQQGAW